MERRIEEDVEGWPTRPIDGGYDGLRQLAAADFSGAVRARGATLFMLNGRIVGVFDGSIDDFDDASGTAHKAPHPGLPLLYAMQAQGGDVRGKYYTNETPISEVDQTLSEGNFTGYIELSENVLSGDYYLVYHAGRAMSLAFIGNSGRLVTGEEAFDRADDEVGIYAVNDVDIEVRDVPGLEDDGDQSADDGAAADSESTADAGATADAGGTADAGTADDGEPGAPATDDAGGAGSDSPEPEPAAGGDEPPAGGAGGDAPANANGGTAAAADPESGASPADAGDGAANAAGGAADAGAGQTDAGAGAADAGAGAADASTGTADRGAGASDADSGAVDSGAASVPDDAGGRAEAEPTDATTDAASAEEPASEEPAAGTEAAASVSAGSTVTSEPEPEQASAGAGTGSAASDVGGGAAETGSAENVASPATGGAVDRGGQPSIADATTIPSLDPDRTGEIEQLAQHADTMADSEPRSGASERRRSRTGSAEDVDGTFDQEVLEREDRIDRLEQRASNLQAERDEIAAERDRLARRVEELEEENEELQARVHRLERQLEEAEANADARADPEPVEQEGPQDLRPRAALEGTDLFVRYDSKGDPTLEDAHDGSIAPVEVNENLRLDLHTRFDAEQATVNGEPFREFLEQTMAYRFVDWLVRRLPYEIRDTGQQAAMRDCYDALPEVDRVEFHGVVEFSYEEEGEAVEAEEPFDVVVRDRMGEALFVADLNDSRDPADSGMVLDLQSGATRVKESTNALAAAFAVTRSFFDPDALEAAAEATSGSLLSRDSRKSYVKVSRKRGYHLCLVEARDGNLHLNVPEL